MPRDPRQFSPAAELPEYKGNIVGPSTTFLCLNAVLISGPHRPQVRGNGFEERAPKKKDIEEQTSVIASMRLKCGSLV